MKDLAAVDMDQLVKVALCLTTQQIVDTLFQIGGGNVNEKLAITRMALLIAYERSEGTTKANKLIRELGI